MAYLEIILLLFVFFEVFYFLRFLIVGIYLKCMKWSGQIDKSPFKEGIVYGMCTTTDLDFLCHMSNSRYLRELDFGRIIFVVRNGMFTSLKKAGIDMAFGALTIRYRRSITLFQIFKIYTKVVYWDDRNVYLEQRMETVHDKFTRAIAYAKVVLVGKNASANNCFKELGYQNITPPVPPPELVKWIEFNDISSKNLQKERDNSSTKNEDASSKLIEADLCTLNKEQKHE